MIRILIYLIFVTTGWAHHSPASAELPPIEFVQIEEGLFAVKDFSNAVFLITDDGVLVVDTLIHPERAELMLAEIRRLTDQPIRWVVNTHAHADHYSGNSVFLAEGATVVAHRHTAQQIRDLFQFEVGRRTSRLAQVGLDTDDVEKVIPTVTYDTAMTIELGDQKIRLMHLGPGQNYGDSLVFFEQAKVLFVGSVFQTGNAWPNPMMTPSFDGWLDVLNQIKCMDADRYVSGHSRTNVLGNRDDLNASIELITTLHEQVAAAISQGLTENETVNAVQLEKYTQWRSFKNREKRVRNVYHLLSTGIPDYFREAGVPDYRFE
ncbi:MBL fold metallo-hydrolase [Pseudomonadota bacterium]